MREPKFKVGDQVRWRGLDGNYEVLEVLGPRYRVVGGTYYEEDLELVPPEPPKWEVVGTNALHQQLEIRRGHKWVATVAAQQPGLAQHIADWLNERTDIEP